MPRFAITEKAGRFVAGQTNNGVGSVLTLTAKQAEHEVRLGTLTPLDVEKPKPAAQKAAKSKKAAAKDEAKAEE